MNPTLVEARKHLREGRVREGEAICRQLLDAEPKNAEAMHLMGLIAHQQRRPQQAESWLLRAIACDPTHAQSHLDLAIILAVGGRAVEALSAVDRAIELRENLAPAHQVRGDVLKSLDDFDRSLLAYRRVIALQPNEAESYVNPGILLAERGRHAEAQALFRQALALRPSFFAAQVNLGSALLAMGRFEECVDALRQAAALHPNDAVCQSLLASALLKSGRLAQAAAAAAGAIALRPELADAHLTLGSAHHAVGRLDQAVACYQRAIALRPAHGESHFHLAQALKEMGQIEQAIGSFRRAVQLRPDVVGYQSALLTHLYYHPALDASSIYAEHCAFDALVARPLWVHARSDEKQTPSPGTPGEGRGEGLSADERKGPRPNPLPEYRAREPERIFPARRNPVDVGTIFSSAHSDALQECRAEGADIAPRRLRIGYVSPDFRSHATSHFSLPLLAEHDHRNFEIFCYADVARPDDVTRKLMACADVWRDLSGQSDEQAARTIANDGIDILVDLALHTPGGRPLLFARKPAPVQVSWLGYPGTTGLSAVDYRLTDPYLDPPAPGRDDLPGPHDAFYSERSIRLPDTCLCFAPLLDDLEPGPLPMLQNRHVTFGSLNSFSKANEQTLGLWANLLRRVEDARLLLAAPAGKTRERVAGIFAAAGVARERIEFIDRQPTRRHLVEIYRRIDVALDTFPWNGHTTSFEALWMGVPVVSLFGQTGVSRAGLCYLSNLGLADLATDSPEQFVEIARQLAANPGRLAELRQNLRARMERSPLMDRARFARNVEAAYRWMWSNKSEAPRTVARENDVIAGNGSGH